MTDYPCLSCNHAESAHRGSWCEECKRVVILDPDGFHEGIHQLEPHTMCVEDGCDCDHLKDEPSSADMERYADGPSAGERREAYEASWAEHVRLHS